MRHMQKRHVNKSIAISNAEELQGNDPTSSEGAVDISLLLSEYPVDYTQSQQTSGVCKPEYSDWHGDTEKQQRAKEVVNLSAPRVSLASGQDGDERDRQEDPDIKPPPLPPRKQQTTVVAVGTKEPSQPLPLPAQATREVYCTTRSIDVSVSIGLPFKPGTWWETLCHWGIVVGDRIFEITGQEGIQPSIRPYCDKLPPSSCCVGTTSLTDNELGIIGEPWTLLLTL
jgi:hypothetical protein